MIKIIDLDSYFFSFFSFIAFFIISSKFFVAPIWLSLIKYSSLKLNLWFVPPPNFTAYFWITLKFGIVFLVQQILVFFPTFFTNWFVLVDIPEICEIKFKATLSAVNIFLIFPSIIAITSLFFIKEPSFFLTLNLILLYSIQHTNFSFNCSFNGNLTWLNLT